MKILDYVKIEKQGIIWRRTSWKKEGKKGGKKKREKSDKNTRQNKKLKWPQQKSTKTGRILEGGGEIFLAAKNIYPCLIGYVYPPIEIGFHFFFKKIPFSLKETNFPISNQEF